MTKKHLSRIRVLRKLTKKFLLDEYVHKKKPYILIAHEQKFSTITIQKRLFELGIPINIPKIYKVSKKWLIGEYVDKKRSLTSIARQFRVTRSTVKKQLIKFGASIRNFKEACLPIGAIRSGRLKWCPMCKTNKVFYNFTRDLKGTYGIHGVCKKCVGKNKKVRDKRDGIQRQINKSKLIMEFGNTCKCCGKSGLPIACYAFHHKNPANKNTKIFKRTFREKSKLIEIRNKCILLCYNCHSTLHFGNITALQHIKNYKLQKCSATNRKNLKKALVVLLLSDKCYRCGKKHLPLSCYTFHHNDPKKKKNNIARTGYSDSALKEINNKCALLCHNCHYVLHHGSLTAKEYLRIK